MGHWLAQANRLASQCVDGSEIGWRGIWFQKKSDGMGSSVQEIADLKEGMANVIVEGTIKNIESPRNVKSKENGRELTVANAILSDNSGEITLVLWNCQSSG